MLEEDDKEVYREDLMCWCYFVYYFGFWSVGYWGVCWLEIGIVCE